MTKTDRMQNLQEAITRFARERNWEQYHTPKNLTMALSVECSELLEIFQWMTPDQSACPDEQTRDHIMEEIGDIMIYLTMTAQSFGFDPIQAATDKLCANQKKYPVPE